MGISESAESLSAAMGSAKLANESAAVVEGLTPEEFFGELNQLDLAVSGGLVEIDLLVHKLATLVIDVGDKAIEASNLATGLKGSLPDLTANIGQCEESARELLGLARDALGEVHPAGSTPRRIIGLASLVSRRASVISEAEPRYSELVNRAAEGHSGVANKLSGMLDQVGTVVNTLSGLSVLVGEVYGEDSTEMTDLASIVNDNAGSIVEDTERLTLEGAVYIDAIGM